MSHIFPALFSTQYLLLYFWYCTVGFDSCVAANHSNHPSVGLKVRKGNEETWKPGNPPCLLFDFVFFSELIEL